MSSHLHVYLGAYAECTYKDTKRTAHVTGCTNTKCKKHPKDWGSDQRGKFCEECASPIGKVAVQVDEHPDDAELTKEALTNANMGDDERTWLIPNITRAGEPRPDLRGDDEVHLDLRGTNPEAEIAWFEKAFAKELAALRPHYAKVEIKWGLHQYFM